MIDLHLHTTISDGTWPPEEVVRRAIDLGLNTIAITDHERTEGIDMAIKAAREYPNEIEIIPGIELFALYGDFEVHILGHFYDYNSPKLQQYLKSLEETRHKQNQVILDKIKHYTGIDIPHQRLYDFTEYSFVSRAQIARALVAENFIKDTQDAFTKELIGNGGKCFAPTTKTPPEDVIENIKKYGGIPVLAHPGYSGQIDLSDNEIEEFREMGILGLECRHMKHNSEMQNHFEQLADRLGLIKTGGSDCHGTIYNPVKIGTVEVPDKWLLPLKAAANIK